MFRRSSISTRLNLLIGLVVTAIVGLIVVSTLAVTGQSNTQHRLLELSDISSAAKTVQYDFAEFNRWQVAYAFDVTRIGISGASDSGPSRKVFLERVAQARLDLAALEKVGQGLAPALGSGGAMQTTF